MSGVDCPPASPLLSAPLEPTVAMTMLNEFVQGLGEGDARGARARFEQVVRRHLHVPYATLREAPPAKATSAAERSSAAMIPVPVAGRAIVLELRGWRACWQTMVVGRRWRPL